MSAKSDGRPFDPAALAQKYDKERRKRMHSDGTKQYIKLEGKFTHYLDDPHTPRKERTPVSKDIEVAILGAGWGALLAAAKLRDANIDDFCLIDKAGDFGGVWYWNRYPGVACDTEAYIYMPLLEELGYMPKKNYADGPEILAHAKAVGRHYGLYDKALFQTEIKEVKWDEAISRWVISTDRGDTLRAKFYIMTSGSLQVPKLPGIPGIDTFEGHSFHTSRWDFDYTGGDSHGNLTKLQDKRVAIIGTGATAIQCVPHLGQWAKQLYVFQRTPSSVDFRNERPTDVEWYKSLKPGWQRRRSINFTSVLSGLPVEEDMVNDYWTKSIYATTQKIRPGMTEAEIGELMQMADYETMEAVRARVEDIVKNKATAEALKPWYNRLCKRPCFQDDYLETFNRPNVTLVDTHGKGVERVTKKGIVVQGKEYEVDCIIYSTGFEWGTYADNPIVPVIGRGGITLAEKWKDGATTLHGIHVHNFPNFYIISLTQSAWGPNFTHMMEEQAIHIAYIIKELQKRNVETAEITAEAEANWVAHHEALAPKIARIWENCTPGFFNNEGNMSRITLRNGPYGDGVIGLVQILEQWRADGNLEGLVLSALPDKQRDVATPVAVNGTA